MSSKSKKKSAPVIENEALRSVYEASQRQRSSDVHSDSDSSSLRISVSLVDNADVVRIADLVEHYGNLSVSALFRYLISQEHRRIFEK